ncbi:NAD-dependent epimerase/dehydratase family protein [bacterium]|nr:NAD-dependent epimerase/dehydratase family protein [bacterium]
MHPIVAEDIRRIIDSNIPWSQLNGATVLIAGANGFLPAYIIETLLHLNDRMRSGIRIIGVARSLPKALARFKNYAGRHDLDFVESDVTKLETIENRTIDYIIHAASQASPKYYGVDPVGTLSANVTGTERLLNMARAHQVKGFLFFSSSEIYGQLTAGQIPVKENEMGTLDPMDVRACYAESKRMGETMCVSWSHQYGIPVKIVRPFHTYGPGMALDDGRVFADFVSNIVRNHDIVMRSEGTATRSFCYLADATAGFFKVLLEGKNGEAYNVGNAACEISIMQLAQLLVGLYPEKKLSVKKDFSVLQNYIPSAVQRIVPDTAKIQKLGWLPIIGLEEGFKRTIETYL